MGTARGPSVIVGMSGGVDSSVAALILRDQGYRVEGLFMKNWEEDDSPEYCAAAEDLRDAQEVCDRLNIPLRSVNFSTEYWDRVFRHFLDEYAAGHTPNPDVACNREIKFKAFLDHALGLGARYIATGHYARIDRKNGSTRLLTGQDPTKDQSYFLYAVPRSALDRTLFPLGSWRKSTVRDRARAAGLATCEKKDSTGLCFIGERRFRDFLARYLPARRGEICTPEGDVIGEHMGLMFYTLGQRQGLGIGGRQGARESPWYVAQKDIDRNRLIVVQGREHPLLYRRTLVARDVRWVRGEAPDWSKGCTAKVRYRQVAQPCQIDLRDDASMHLQFDMPQWAVTPGQSVVIYTGDECLGGGIIAGNGGRTAS